MRTLDRVLCRGNRVVFFISTMDLRAGPGEKNAIERSKIILRYLEIVNARISINGSRRSCPRGGQDDNIICPFMVR